MYLSFDMLFSLYIACLDSFEIFWTVEVKFAVDLLQKHTNTFVKQKSTEIT